MYVFVGDKDCTHSFCEAMELILYELMNYEAYTLFI